MSPDNENPADDEPITPEVVDGGGRGAAARKRRVTGARGADDAGAPIPGLRGPRGPRGARQATGSIFRLGCMALVALGLLGVLYGGRQATDPSGTRCTLARNALDSADDHDVEDWEHVPLPEGVEKAKELDCDDAIARAGDLPEDEEDSICGQAREAIEDNGLPEGIDDAGDIPCNEVGDLTADISGFDPTPPSGDFVAEGTIRNFGAIIAVVGLGQAVAGFFLLRTKSRQVRTAALVATALGILTGSGLGIIGLLVLVFVVYALAFSADAKSLFPPNPNGGGFLRPRPPRQQPPADN